VKTLVQAKRPGKLLKFLFYPTFLISIAMPHSFQEITAAMIFITALVSFSYIIKDDIYNFNYIDSFFIFSVFINLLYIYIGIVNNSYPDSILQNIIVFLISPLMWILIFKGVSKYIGVEFFIHILSYYSILSACTVAIFFYLFFNFGSDSVTIFLKEPNITNRDGVYAATLAVYASFIFLSSAFLSMPHIIEKTWLRITCLTSILVVAITSGRSAVIIAGVLGIILYFIFNKFQNSAPATRHINIGKIIVIIVSLVFILLSFAVFLQFFPDINLSYTIESVYVKIFEAGGEARRDQWSGLLEGIYQTAGLGAGHGVGVDIIRSNEFPWRYEIFPIAMVYRVGIFGFSLLMLPYCIYFYRFLTKMFMHRATPSDKFMFAGFLGILLASWTNPYPESFIYQWMLLAPMVLFEEHSHAVKRDN
jgi:hypothetical protein